MTSVTDGAPDRSRSVTSYRKLAASYDASCRFILDIRRATMEALHLRGGETVFDIACGTGATLPFLAERVGPSGKVIGIEHSPDMAAIAHQRITASGFSNIELIVAPAEQARSGHRADALLFCFTHDVLQSPAALDNIFSMAQPSARIAVVGSKLISQWWSAPIDAWTRVRTRRYLTTYRGLDQPWVPLQQFCPDLEVSRTFHLGTSYLARGIYLPHAV